MGLDPDLSKIPAFIKNKYPDSSTEQIKAFLLPIIEKISDHVLCYKPNIAFFESLGWEGYKVLEEVLSHIPKEIAILLDAKRGDIGNTSERYAEAYFSTLNVDAVTLSPYMGSDSFLPYTRYPGKQIFLLLKTSNLSASDIQCLKLDDGKHLYQALASQIKQLNQGFEEKKIGVVVGATDLKILSELRTFLSDEFFLIPGVGAQGALVAEVQKCLRESSVEAGPEKSLINMSRAVLYASNDQDYLNKALEVVLKFKEF